MTLTEIIDVTIANKRVRVPVCGDPATTEKVAEKVTRRVHQIEEDYGRVNTQEYALRAAFEFAAELEALHSARAEETRALTKRLQQILSRLRDLEMEHSPD